MEPAAPDMDVLRAEVSAAEAAQSGSVIRPTNSTVRVA
jgi:hypothetical protein